jgi:hypothetical protein
MAPPPGIDTNRIKDSALKDLLDLLEGVSSSRSLSRPLVLNVKLGSRQESPSPRPKLERPHRSIHEVLCS